MEDENEQIGWLVCGDMVWCHDCVAAYTIKPGVRLYRVNVAPYKQTCHRCCKVLNAPGTPAWCELFPPTGNQSDGTMQPIRMTSDQAFAQGARCGHLEGKDRVGQYVSGEEFDLSRIATEVQGLPTGALYDAWAAGYRHGYTRAASGEALESNLVNG